MAIESAASFALLAADACSVRAFDAILQWQYWEHIADWFADGQPVGTTWKPPNAAGWMSKYVTRGRFVAYPLSIRWLLATPSWARGDARAVILFRVFRACGWVWLIGFFATAAWSFGLPR
jgi:hypothetical protein